MLEVHILAIIHLGADKYFNLASMRKVPIQRPGDVVEDEWVKLNALQRRPPAVEGEAGRP